jgi:hypothetical protein
MRAAPPAGRTPNCFRELITPTPFPAVPTVVAVRTERAEVARVIGTAMTAFNDMINDQAAAYAAAKRAAVRIGAPASVNFERYSAEPLPCLPAVIRIV